MDSIYTTAHTITQVVRTIKTVVNGNGPDNAYITVRPRQGGRSISLVIGAMDENASADKFSKAGVAELIEILKEIHEAMAD